MPKHIGSSVQDYLSTVVYVGTAAPSLTANLTRYVTGAVAGTATNKYVDLLKLAAGS
jgi:hypothetical protein